MEILLQINKLAFLQFTKDRLTSLVKNTDINIMRDDSVAKQ